MVHVFPPYEIHIIRMGRSYIILWQYYFLRNLIIYRIIKSLELPTFYIKVPIRYSHRFKRKFYFVISRRKFPVQLLQLRYILPKAGKNE